MLQFVVRKNTMTLDEHLAGLYVNDWAVFDVATGSKVCEYATEELAEKNCKNFEQYGLTRDVVRTQSCDKTVPANQCGDNRHVRQDRHSNRRRVVLDK